MVSGLFRRYSRRGNTLLIWLTLEQWPEVIPLPPDTILHVFGEDGPLAAHWEIVLRDNETEEHLFGWFNTSLTPEAAIEWYRDVISQKGWDENRAKYFQLAGNYHME